ncbi:hypothetical protein BKA63DRAFT_71114 [Paraphoma chrysanthemicola]|nr:hypothetical protein BKA63DRAFT_71114 [Paraphoma chrysanthemicola]
MHVEFGGSEDAEFTSVVQAFMQIPLNEEMDNLHPTGTFTPNSSGENANQQRSKGIKRQFQSVSLGTWHAESDSPAISLKRRKKLTPEQLEGVRAVRASGACLRCYIQKQKCSEGRPCKTCQPLLEKARNTNTLQWTACVSSSLSDLNIFTLGVSVLGDTIHHPSGEHPRQKLDSSMAFCLYTLLFERGWFCDDVPIDDLYTQIMRHRYGDWASEVHPFILTDRNPLYRLIQLNVILLGSPIIATELIGRVRYLQQLRAICAIVAFECLDRALDRTNLATSNQTRQSALVMQAALLLDQVVQTRGDLPAAAISCARGERFDEMRCHLIQFLSCYIKRLSPDSLKISNCLRGLEHRGHLDETFWITLGKLMPEIPLHGSPIRRKYADMDWVCDEARSGVALHEYFSSRCSISCN